MAKTTHFFIRTMRNPEFEMSWANESQWQPRADVYQTDEAVLISIEAAGIQRENLKLRLENGGLVVEGERVRPALPCPQHCLQVEISYGAFRRVLPLPPDVDGDNIEAHYDAGILQIVVPRKKPEQQNVQLTIR